jgi:hypothetical protein
MASIILDAAAYLTVVILPVCIFLALFTLGVITINLLHLGRHGMISPLFAGNVEARMHHHSPSLSLWSWIPTLFIGPLRSDAEKQEIKDGLTLFLDEKTSFRRHM